VNRRRLFALCQQKQNKLFLFEANYSAKQKHFSFICSASSRSLFTILGC
jgi:hypothetical protein